MHRLLLGIALVGALVVCDSLLVGCRWREKSESPAAERSARASVSSAETAPEELPAAAAGATQASASAPGEQPSSTSDSSASAAPAADAPAGQVDSEPLVEDATASHRVTAGKPAPEQTWSTQRLVLLAAGGPRVIDLRINVQGNDLPAGLSQATDWLAEELEFDFDSPVSWDALLDKPLVKSGWFGNLVPSAEQRAELLAMYDKENIGTVDVGEFQAFVTRGLSRRDHVRVARAAPAAPLVPATSSWGPLDQDDDGQLSAEELNRAGEALMHFDFDGDGIISDRELRSSGEAMSDARNMSRSSGLLDLSLVLAPNAKQPTALERTVHEHYTFAEMLPRDAFFSWDERRWSEVDRDAKGAITKRDLAPLHDMLADAQVDVAFPNSLDAASTAADSEGQGDEAGAAALGASVACHSERDPAHLVWTAGAQGGRLLLPGCVVLVQVRDDYSPQARRLASQQFSRALEEPQLAAALAGPLELKEGAWDLLRERGPDAASRAWSWLVAARHFHVTASWSAVERPWFELVDANGDRRLSGLELSEFQASSERWDRNLNGRLEEEELPLVVSLTIAREDNRLANFPAGGMNIEKGGASNTSGPSWFAAMDYNSDGELTHAEFLGEDAAFAAFDTNGDGIIDVREVYAPH